MTDAVAAWLAGCHPDIRPIVDALRSVIAQAAPDMVEEVKWNAPSFRDGTDHKVTLGVERRGGVRLVLHRGAVAKSAAAFSFDDPDRLARWPASDRGVILFDDADAVAEVHGKLVNLAARWIAATRAAG